jgi:hypothetical protein
MIDITSSHVAAVLADRIARADRRRLARTAAAQTHARVPRARRRRLSRAAAISSLTTKEQP